MLLTQWWVWAVAGLVLGILEVALPGFVLLGFAIGAMATAGLLLALGPGMAPGLPVLLLVFALASGVAWIVLRRVFALRRAEVKRWERDINDG
jgi:membrane protein implicated in regulation of membrane protease activity